MLQEKNDSWNILAAYNDSPGLSSKKVVLSITDTLEYVFPTFLWNHGQDILHHKNKSLWVVRSQERAALEYRREVILQQENIRPFCQTPNYQNDSWNDSKNSFVFSTSFETYLKWYYMTVGLIHAVYFRREPSQLHFHLDWAWAFIVRSQNKPNL